MILIYLQMLDTPEDRKAFLGFYDAYKDVMYKVAFKILGNNADAEDAVHQAFLSVLENFDRYSKKLKVGGPETKAFFVVIAERKSFDIIRKRLPLTDKDFDFVVNRIPAHVNGDSDLTRALNEVSIRYREYFLMHYDIGFSYKEMAEILGESYETVRKTVYRAKMKIRETLKGNDRNI